MTSAVFTDLDRDCSETACSPEDALQPRVGVDRAAFLCSLACVRRGKNKAFLLPNELLLNNHACRIKVGALLGMERLDSSESVGSNAPVQDNKCECASGNLCAT